MTETAKRIVPASEKRLMAVVIGLGVLILLLLAAVVGVIASRAMGKKDERRPLETVLPRGAAAMSANIEGEKLRILYRAADGRILLGEVGQNGKINVIAVIKERQ